MDILHFSRIFKIFVKTTMMRVNELGRYKSYGFFSGMGTTASVQLHSPSSESDIEIGGEVVLKCIAEGNGEMKYDWFR